MSDEPTPKRKSKTALIVLLLVLVGGYVGIQVAMQMHESGGPSIAWSTDLNAALKRAAAEKRRVFLYLYQPGDQFAQRNEREIFTQRSIRETLRKLICVRIELRADSIEHEQLRAKYGFTGPAQMSVLHPDGTRVSQPIQGLIDEKNFRTYIANHAEPHEKNPAVTTSPSRAPRSP